jgi:hypothetical protein
MRVVMAAEDGDAGPASGSKPRRVPFGRRQDHRLDVDPALVPFGEIAAPL